MRPPPLAGHHTAMSYVCQRCGEYHDELPFAYGALAPQMWTADLEDDDERADSPPARGRAARGNHDGARRRARRPPAASVVVVDQAHVGGQHECADDRYDEEPGPDLRPHEVVEDQ